MAMTSAIGALCASARASCLGSVLAGGLLMLWPAWLNGYPIVFMDTISYANHSLDLQAPWERPAGYGLFLLATHFRLSLWLTILVQGLLLSALLWLVQQLTLGSVRPLRHLVLMALLAGGTSAPWFAADVMPDAFTGMVPLSLFVLSFGVGRLGRAHLLAVGALATLAISVHVSHLITALTVLLAALVLRRRWRALLAGAVPLMLAIAFWLISNQVVFGRLSLSETGPVFLLARLQEDGPAVATLRSHCPAAGWHLCHFPDRLPIDSDLFLWNPSSPLNQDPTGAPRQAPRVFGYPGSVDEASQIVSLTLREQPLAVAWAMAGNTLQQLVLVRVNDFLEQMTSSFPETVLTRFPPWERAQFQRALQADGRLEAEAAPFLRPHVPVVLLAVVALAVLGARRLAGGLAAPGDAQRQALVLCVLLGVLGNAFATGALSKPHERYQARIVWLLPLAAGLAWWPLLSRQRPPG